MKRGLGFLVILLIIMIAGSVLTTGVWKGLPVMHQTSDPMGSYFQAPPGKAAFFFIVVTALLAGAIVNGIVIGLIIWFLHWALKRTEQIPNRSEGTVRDSEALPEKASA